MSMQGLGTWGTGLVAAAGLALCLTGCAASGNGTAAAATSDAAPGALGDAGSAQEALPPGWSQSSSGTLSVPTTATRFEVSPVFVAMSKHMAISNVSLSNEGEVRAFSIKSAASLEPGTYEATFITVDAHGRVTNLVPRVPNAAATTDCCWMIVTSRPGVNDFSCSGSCTAPNSACAVQFQVVGDDTTFWCECVPTGDG